MKCYKCHKDVHDQLHCPYCGALLKPTHKLMEAVKVHDRQAIIQLYRMSAHQIDYKLRSQGLDAQTSALLINKAFKKLLEGIYNLKDLQGFSALLDGVCDHTAYSYIVEHQLAVQPCQVEDQPVIITREDIARLYDDLAAQEESSSHPSFRKPILIGIVSIAMVMACVIGIYNFQMRSPSKKAAKTDILKAYAKVGDEYQQAVTQLYTTRHETSSFTHKYKKAYRAAQVVYYHNKLQPQLKQSLYDIDHDDVKELIVGYPDKKNFIITGIYRYNANNHQATSLNIVKDFKHYYNTVLGDQNKIVVMKSKTSGTAYTLKDQQLKTVNKNITDVKKYLGKHQKTLNMKSLDHLHDQLDRETNKGKVYNVVNMKYTNAFSTSSYDLDQDGKNDALKVTPYVSDTSEDNTEYKPYYTIRVNGKDFTIQIPDVEYYIELDSYVLRGENGSVFLLAVTQEATEENTWTLFTYRRHKVVPLLEKTDLGKNVDDVCNSFTKVSVKGNALTIRELANTAVISWFEFTTTYRMEKGNLIQKSLAHAILPNTVNSLDPQKMVLQTRTSFMTYTTPECTAQGMRIPEGAKVEVSSFYLENGFDAYAIKYHNQMGYIKNTHYVDNFGSKYFANLEYAD